MESDATWIAGPGGRCVIHYDDVLQPWNFNQDGLTHTHRHKNERRYNKCTQVVYTLTHDKKQLPTNPSSVGPKASV